MYDVDYWKRSGAPLKQIITHNGKISMLNLAGVFNSLDPISANKNMQQFLVCSLNRRKRLVELLKDCGASRNPSRHYKRFVIMKKGVSTSVHFNSAMVCKVVEYKANCWKWVANGTPCTCSKIRKLG